MPIKHNFAEAFDRLPFVGSIQSPKKMRNGRVNRDDAGNCTYFENHILSRGCVRPYFWKEHGLDANSNPVEWMAPFWPRNNDLGKYSIAQCTTNSNLKASLMNAVPGGTSYKGFESFSVDECRNLWECRLRMACLRHLGLRWSLSIFLEGSWFGC